MAGPLYYFSGSLSLAGIMSWALSFLKLGIHISLVSSNDKELCFLFDHNYLNLDFYISQKHISSHHAPSSLKSISYPCQLIAGAPKTVFFRPPPVYLLLGSPFVIQPAAPIFCFCFDLSVCGLGVSRVKTDFFSLTGRIDSGV